MSITITSSQLITNPQANNADVKNVDPNSKTYKASIASGHTAEGAKAEKTALNVDSTASAKLKSNTVAPLTALPIPDPKNTDANETILMEKLDVIANSNYADGTAEGSLAVIMMLLLQFAQITKTAARAERKAELDSALATLNSAADKIHNAALDRYKGAVGKAVFEIAGAATTIASSVALVAHTQPDPEPVAPTRGIETDAEFQTRVTAYENTPDYKTAANDGTLAAYEQKNPRPVKLSATNFANETDAEYHTRVTNYDNDPAPQGTRPVHAESDADWQIREDAHKEAFSNYTQNTNMKQTMLMTYSQLTGAIGQLVSAPGGVFEASYNLKAAGEETEQKKLEALAQRQNALADDAQSTKQSMGETISTIISTLKDIKKDINDLTMSIIRAV